LSFNQSYNCLIVPPASRDATSCRKRSLHLRIYFILTLNFCTGQYGCPTSLCGRDEEISSRNARTSHQDGDGIRIRSKKMPITGFSEHCDSKAALLTKALNSSKSRPLCTVPIEHRAGLWRRIGNPFLPRDRAPCCRCCGLSVSIMKNDIQ
jgi:hypothetical protein